MPELPDRPDIDQLRHQARDLHRAAIAGVPDAIARIRAVSDRTALSTAQLALAREYGYPSWPALQTEVERRRATFAAASPHQPAPDVQSPAYWLDQRHSFGGGSSIRTAEGVLSPDVLAVGYGHAELHGSAVLYPQAPSGRVMRRWRQSTGPRFDDLSVTDDKGTTYTVRFGSGSLHFATPAEPARRSEVSFWVDPVPPANTSWVELRAQGGSATRLVPSPRARVGVRELTEVAASAATERRLETLAFRLLELRHSNPFEDLTRDRAIVLDSVTEIRQSGESGGTELADQVVRLCDRLTDQHLEESLPVRWYRFLDALNQADGPVWHLDIGAAAPRLDGVAIQLDHAVSRPDSWRLYLRAMPTWWGRSEDGHRKWELVSVRAEDDQGGRYLSTFGGSTGHTDREELELAFVPRIDPLARNLKLTFGADAAEAAVELDLASAA
jgi:hypothetical protein